VATSSATDSDCIDGSRPPAKVTLGSAPPRSRASRDLALPGFGLRKFPNAGSYVCCYRLQMRKRFVTWGDPTPLLSA
jgi:hypothetical protein